MPAQFSGAPGIHQTAQNTPKPHLITLLEDGERKVPVTAQRRVLVSVPVDGKQVPDIFEIPAGISEIPEYFAQNLTYLKACGVAVYNVDGKGDVAPEPVAEEIKPRRARPVVAEDAEEASEQSEEPAKPRRGRPAKTEASE